MSGPIVRTGTNPKFWSNYDRIFGNKAAATPAKKEAKAATKAAKKAAPKKAAKKAAKKTAKKK